MARCFMMSLVLLAVAGCATQPFVAGPCAVGDAARSVVEEVFSSQANAAGCGPSVAENRAAATIGAVSQTRSQTRTVGVPRGFLVAMIVLILLIGLV